MNTDKEYILCSALWLNDGNIHPHQPLNIIEGYVICGRRHHNCFATLSVTLGNGNYDKSAITQGFVTSKDRFVDRKFALKIALDYHQVDFDSLTSTKELYSEDLW